MKVSTASRRISSRTASGSRAGTTSSIPPSSYLAVKSYQSPLRITISPGTDARGSSRPITEHSTSIPSEKPSTMTRLSCAKAASSAAPISASDHTLLIPTEEPSRAGLTNTGVPSTVSSCRTASGSPRQRCSRTAAEGTCGTPAAASTCLKTTLSMHSDDASTPAPT